MKRKKTAAKKELLKKLESLRRENSRLKAARKGNRGNRKQQSMIDESQRMLFTLMSNLPGMAYRCQNNSNRTIEFVSGGCYGLTGYRFSDLYRDRKVSYGQLIHPDDRAALQQEIGAAIKEKKPFKFIYRIKTATGKKKWVWEQGRSIFSFYDKTLIIEGFITDITDRKHIEEELKAAFDELKITQDQLIQSEKFSAIGRLASGVAHEVKNPLAVILQGIEYLQNKLVTDDETVTTALQRMYAAVGRANNIIKGMLDFSSISIMKKKPCSLNAIIENSLLLLKNDLDRYHVNVVTDLMPDLPNISIDKNRIEQVLINLLINATQAMPEGGRLTVKTYMKEKNKKVVVEIEDTGYGIPKDILGKIFDPFFTTKLHIGGAGLGLSIVRNIIGKHEGTIKVENKKSGQGTIVFLEFKL